MRRAEVAAEHGEFSLLRRCQRQFGRLARDHVHEPAEVAGAHLDRDPLLRGGRRLEVADDELRLAEQEMPGLMALRARYKGKPLGSHGHPAVWAFYPNKQMTTGEGGAVTTASAEQHELLTSLRNQGRLETSSWLQHGRLGYNYRLDEPRAALALARLDRLDADIARGVNRLPARFWIASSSAAAGRCACAAGPSIWSARWRCSPS